MSEMFRCGCGEVIYFECDFSPLPRHQLTEIRFSDFRGREIRVCLACGRDLNEEYEATAEAEMWQDIRRRESMGMSLGPHLRGRRAS